MDVEELRVLVAWHRNDQELKENLPKDKLASLVRGRPDSPLFFTKSIAQEGYESGGAHSL